MPNIPKDVYKFTQEGVASAEIEWKETLIGVVVGARVSRKAMVNFMTSSWNVAKPKLNFKDNGVIMLKFCSHEDKLWVLEKGPWLLKGLRPLILNGH